MTLINLKILAFSAVFLVSGIAGAIPLVLKKQDKTYAFNEGEAFACGIFLGAGLLHMLNHALNAAIVANVSSRNVLLCMVVSFLAMLLLEHISRYYADHNKKLLPLLATAILCLHSVAEGVALGMARSSETLMVVLVAILSHKWAAGFALAVLLAKRLKTAWPAYLFFASMTPLGIFYGNNLMHWHNDTIGIYAHAIAAGSFLYIGTLHGLKQAVLVDRCCDLKTFIWVLVGFTSMALIH